MLPKHKATTVQVRMITLYGMLKSGVGRESNKLVVRMAYSPELSTMTAALRGQLENFNLLESEDLRNIESAIGIRWVLRIPQDRAFEIEGDLHSFVCG